jgi:hypothetical protein
MNVIALIFIDEDCSRERERERENGNCCVMLMNTKRLTSIESNQLPID